MSRTGGQTERINTTINRALYAYANQRIKSGDYSGYSDIFSDALRLHREKHQAIYTVTHLKETVENLKIQLQALKRRMPETPQSDSVDSVKAELEQILKEKNS